MSEVKKTDEATEAPVKKNANVYKAGYVVLDVSSGTIGRGEAKASIRSQVALAGQEITPKELKAEVQQFMDWQRSHHGKRVAAASNEASTLMQTMIDAGYELDLVASRTSGKVTMTLTPDIKLSSTLRGVSKIKSLTTSIIALIAARK